MPESSDKGFMLKLFTSHSTTSEYGCGCQGSAAC